MGPPTAGAHPVTAAGQDSPRPPICTPSSGRAWLAQLFPGPAEAHQLPEGWRWPPADGTLVGCYDDAALPANRQCCHHHPAQRQHTHLHANSLPGQGGAAFVCRSIPRPHCPDLSWGSQRETLWDGGQTGSQGPGNSYTTTFVTSGNWVTHQVSFSKNTK